jgi:ABC-type branched-subunit amino acid transport system substrate-binding protein
MTRRRICGLLVVLALVAAGCAEREGSDDGNEASSEDSTPSDGGGSGTFGDMESPCGPQAEDTAEPASSDPAETQGVEDGTIRLGTVSDPGFEGRPGLNQELFDSGNAFAEWCNEQGGINGRTIELTEYDAAIFQYQQRLGEACVQEFAMVGGGAVSDNLWATTGAECGLIDVAGFATTPEKAGMAGNESIQENRTIQAIPNPSNQFPVGAARILAEEFPDAPGNAEIIYGDIATTQVQKDRQVEALSTVGYDFTEQVSYNILGEANWAPFASAIRDEEITYLSFVGEGANMAQIQVALEEQGYSPEVTQVDANLYDPEYVEAAGGAADGTFLRLALWPFEEAEQNPTGATAQYMDLIEEQDGKIASLGAQSFSAWLLFAQLAGECDVAGDLTRQCILDGAGDIHDWTGGGLHAPSNVGDNEGTECTVVMQVDDEEFVRAYPAEPGDDFESGFDCSPENVVDLEGTFAAS